MTLHFRMTSYRTVAPPIVGDVVEPLINVLPVADPYELTPAPAVPQADGDDRDPEADRG